MEQILFAVSALAVGGLLGFLWIKFMTFVMGKLVGKWEREINNPACMSQVKTKKNICAADA